MALHNPLWLQYSITLLKAETFPPGVLSVMNAYHKKHWNLRLSSADCSNQLLLFRVPYFAPEVVRASKMTKEVELSDSSSDEESHKTTAKAKSDTEESDDDDDVFLMDDEEREEWRRKIHQVIDTNPDIEEEIDPEERRKKMQKLLADYPLVAEEDDPDWPEDADGWGFNFDQFFNKITIKNVKKDNDDEDEDYDSDKEIVWQDDNYIRPIKDITTLEWEDTVFKDFNPLVILVHNRYKRPRENERARCELEKAVQTFWESGLPSPRCVAVDAVVEQDLVSALKVSVFPEIIFTKAGKVLHRDKVVRTADEWSKIMAFFYYKAVRPPWLDSTVGQSQEKIPSLQ